MPCTPIKGDGFQGIICSRRPPRKKCHYCGQPSDRLCDFPLFGEGHEVGDTCDVPMCFRCTWSPFVEKDYCRPHREIVQKERATKEAP